MRVGELQVLKELEQVDPLVTERFEPYDGATQMVFGLDKNDPSYDDVAAQITRLRTTDPKLYHKIVTLS